MDPSETLEKLQELLEELDELSRGAPIIVEGRRDREALLELGVEGHIIVLNDGRSILGTCEELAKSWERVIILTDWDRKGGQLARLLKEALEICQLRYDADVRMRLSRLVKKETKDVEGLSGLVARLGRGTSKSRRPKSKDLI